MQLLGYSKLCLVFVLKKRNRERDQWDAQEAEKARKERELLELERRNHEDEERRIQWTLDAYKDLYKNVIMKIEVKKKFSDSFRQREDYKEFRHFIDQLELFGKGLYECNLYHRDTFLKLSTPGFPLFVNNRVGAFFDACNTGDDSYVYTKRLMEDTKEFYEKVNG